MENLGEIAINGKNINLDTMEIKDLEGLLTEVQNQKKSLKDDLDNILEEIYN